MYKSILEREHNEIKEKHKVSIVLFRCGDFYETMREDAEIVSEVTGLLKTFRFVDDEKIYLCGFPYQALDEYLPMMTKNGYRVAIVDFQELKQ